MATVVSGDFEWDVDKATANEAKHKVGFEDAALAPATDQHVVASQIPNTRAACDRSSYLDARVCCSS